MQSKHRLPGIVVEKGRLVDWLQGWLLGNGLTFPGGCQTTVFLSLLVHSQEKSSSDPFICCDRHIPEAPLL